MFVFSVKDLEFLRELTLNHAQNPALVERIGYAIRSVQASDARKAEMVRQHNAQIMARIKGLDRQREELLSKLERE